MVQLSEDQKTALSHLLEWYRKDRNDMRFVTLGGYAGTGKTTLISVIRKELGAIDPGLKVGFASYTGKAARVLEEKVRAAGMVSGKDSIGTIHSLIYTPILDAKEQIVGWKTKEKIDRDLIIIDEGSMVDAVIWEHLLSYGVPVIVVGDHGQLPPIRGSYSLMRQPHLRLEEIHRQAKKNPIVALSVQAREHGEIPVGRFAPHVVKYAKDDPMTGEAMQEMLSRYDGDTLILCGYNRTRKRLNAYIRQQLGYTSEEPSVGDRVICLRNNHKARIYNGMLGTVRNIYQQSPDSYTAEIDLDGERDTYSGRIAVSQFNADSALNFTEQRAKYTGMDLFDFGYALTVHKAQGSQAKRVILFEERFAKMTDDDWKRWLYTAVTRAEEELYIFPSP